MTMEVILVRRLFDSTVSLFKVETRLELVKFTERLKDLNMLIGKSKC